MRVFNKKGTKKVLIGKIRINPHIGLPVSLPYQN